MANLFQNWVDSTSRENRLDLRRREPWLQNLAKVHSEVIGDEIHLSASITFQLSEVVDVWSETEEWHRRNFKDRLVDEVIRFVKGQIEYENEP